MAEKITPNRIPVMLKNIADKNPAEPQSDSDPASNNLDQEPQLQLPPRDELSGFVEEYDTEKRPLTNERRSLADLEGAVLSDNTAIVDTRIDVMRKSYEGDSRVDAVEQYLNGLRDAADKKRNGEDSPEIQEIEGYLAQNLAEKRGQFAKLTYEHINSTAGLFKLRLPKFKRELEAAESGYNETLRTYANWQTLGLDDEQRRQTESALAAQEVFEQHNMINQQQEATDSEPKGKMGSMLERVDKISKTGKEFSVFGKKVRLTLGHAAVIGAGAAIGGAVRMGLNATGFGVTGTIAGASAGAVAGGVIGGLRTHKNTKVGLGEIVPEHTDAEVNAARERAAKNMEDGADLAEAIQGIQAEKIDAAMEVRRKKIGRAALRGVKRGAIAGAIGGGVADLIGGVVDAATSDASAESMADTKSDIAAIEPNPEAGERPSEVVSETETIQESEPTPLTTEEMISEHADNVETATTIESGEGLSHVFDKLGVPEDQLPALLENENLADKLVENGDAYKMEDGGIGLSHTGELSSDSVRDIYEAASLDNAETVEVPTSDIPLYEDLPESYSDLPDNVQEFAHGHSVITDIPSGMGGEQLMYELGADPSDWYKFEDQLLSAAPDDFYRMPDGHVGISHTGALSADGLKAIADGISKHGYSLVA